jgi:S-disulfanyl-L-cysteine oxidoreductase SoxD
MFKWLSPGCDERLRRWACARVRLVHVAFASLASNSSRSGLSSDLMFFSNEPFARCPQSAPTLARFAPHVTRHALFATLVLASACAFAQTPGRPATPAEIKAWNIDVRADFKGLPAGSGSVAKGQQVWEAQCESCHGAFGESNEVFTPIVGHTTKEDMKAGRVAKMSGDQVPQRTTLMKLSQLSTLWDYINRAMPWNAPKTLTTEEVYAVTAYILHLGDIVPADFVLSDKNVRDVQAKLPNRDGKTNEHGMWNVTDKPDVQGSSCRINCDAKVEITSRLPDYARNAHGNLAAQMRLIGGVRGANTLQPAPSAFVAGSAVQTAATSKPTAASTPTAAKPDAAKLAQQHACMACHGVANKLVGPSLIDVHKKYKDAKDVVALIATKIKAGGGGVWGAIPMPAQGHVPDADIRAMAEWIAKGEFK